MEREFTAVIQKRGRSYIAWVEEVPGANTQGRTLAEVRRNLREALRLILNVEMLSVFEMRWGMATAQRARRGVPLPGLGTRSNAGACGAIF